MRGYHRWTRGEEELLIALYERHMSPDKVAERLELPVTAVRSRIALLRSRYRLPETLIGRRVPHRKWTVADIARVIGMRKNRKKVHEIAAELDTSESVIRNMLHRLKKEGRL